MNQFQFKTSGLALAGALALGGTALAFDLGKGKSDNPPPKIPVDETAVPRDGMPRGSFAPVIKKVAPGVVKIVVTTKAQNPSIEGFSGSDDPFWRRFFGGQSGPMTPRQPGGQLEHGLGSGVIVTKDGYILTNNHVVDGAKDVKVTLQDGREFTAKVIGRDAKSDVAVVKVNATDLPVVPLADSDKVQVGDVVLAIGNPFGVGQTVTSGIVSATDRGNVMGPGNYEDFIQTDAAINPGNSGGALVDIDGRLIGINTAIMSRSGGSQGVGFAVPSKLASTVMDSLIANGHVTRGYMGVMIQTMTPSLADEFKLKEAKGAVVTEVTPNSPAEKAGIQVGDVITGFNGKPVTDSRHLQLDVAATAPGTSMPVQVSRNGESKSLEVTVKQLPGTESLAENNSPNGTDTGTLNGVTVSDLDSQARGHFQIPETVKGAIVTEVDPASPAAEAGLKAGDVIQEINRHPVKDANEAVHLTENTKSKRTLLRIWEDGGSHYVVVDESAAS